MAESETKEQRPRQHQDHQPGRRAAMTPPPHDCAAGYSGSGKLVGKVALVTGGDSGIGRSVAVSFAKEGATVAIVYLDEDRDAGEAKRLVEEQGVQSFLLVNKETEPRLYDKTKEPLVMGSNSAPRTGVQMALWGIAYLGWNARWVTAYRGTNDMFLALERGEIDMAATANYFQVEKALATGKFKVLAQSGTLEDGKIVPRPELADTPIFSDMMKGKITDKLGQQGFDYWLSMCAIDKWVALPPDTPNDIVSAYRGAFRKMAADPAFVSEGKKMSEDFTPMSADDVQNLVRTIGGTPPDAIDSITAMMRRQGIRVQ